MIREPAQRTTSKQWTIDILFKGCCMTVVGNCLVIYRLPSYGVSIKILQKISDKRGTTLIAVGHRTEFGTNTSRMVRRCLRIFVRPAVRPGTKKNNREEHAQYWTPDGRVDTCAPSRTHVWRARATVHEEVGARYSVAICEPTIRRWQKRTGHLFLHVVCPLIACHFRRTLVVPTELRITCSFPNRVQIPSTFSYSNVTQRKGIASFSTRPFCRPIIPNRRRALWRKLVW